MCAALLLAATATQAQTPSDTTSARSALVQRGRAVAVGAVSELAPRSACFTCHGLDGAGDGSGAFPRLTGQAGWYLYKQLKDYASGARPNDVMSPIARALSEAQMEAVSAFYAAQKTVAKLPERLADPQLVQSGGVIVASGLAAAGVQACVNCHGPFARGLPPSFPYLASQYASYTELQMQLFRDGVRNNDPLGVMRDVTRALTPEQIRAIALYLESVPLLPTPTAPESAPPTKTD
jgi:cytochrome c553